MSVLSMRSPVFHSTPRRITPTPTADLAATRRVASELLLGGSRELVIQHHGRDYHLRLTRNDKLILTK